MSQTTQNVTPTAITARPRDGSLPASQLSVNILDVHLTVAEPSLEWNLPGF